MGFEKESKRGLKSLTKFARKKNLINNYWLEKIDLLRKKRNPSIHLKPYKYEFNLTQRIFRKIGKKEPFEILENDAKEAISLMYQISITDFGENLI
jgi:hypothetical protein